MRYEVLVRNSDFSRAYARGKSFVHPHMVLYVNKNRARHLRVGITATKKVGNAVTRNRARRVMRAALAEVLPDSAQHVDLVLVCRAQTPRLKSWQLARTLEKLLRKAQIEGVRPAAGAPGAEPAPALAAENASPAAKIVSPAAETAVPASPPAAPHSESL